MVFGSSGPITGTSVDVSIRAPSGRVEDLLPRPCGPGCFTQAFDLEPGRTRVTVSATGGELTGGYFTGELTWPPETADPGRLESLVERMRAVPELTLVETVDSGPGSVVTPGKFVIDGDRFVDAEPYAAANLDQVWVLPGEPQRIRLYVPGSRIFAELELDGKGRLATQRLVTPGHLITREFAYPDSSG